MSRSCLGGTSPAKPVAPCLTRGLAFLTCYAADQWENVRMFAYLISRWSFARRFGKRDSDYVYRRRPDLPGFIVSEAERREALRDFRGHYWKSWLLMLSITFAGVLAVALLGMALDLGESLMSILSMALVGAVMFLVLRQHWRLTSRIEQRFQSNPVVASELSTGGWLCRYKSLANQRSWLMHGVFIAVFSSLLWLVFPRSADAKLEQLVLAVFFAVMLSLAIYGVAIKARSLRIG